MPQIRKEQLNSLSANWSAYTYTATAGDTFTDLPVGFQSSTVTQVSGGETSTPTRGIITVAPSNYVKIKLQSDGSSLSDTGTIFGRLTYSAGTYTVTYYKLSAGSEVSATLPGSGSYDLIMMFPEVMNFEEVPFDSLITLGENSGGSGGGSSVGTVIPNGGTLSGVYDADVFCQGSATVAGNLTVNGDLIVVGDLTNDSGYSVTTVGDLKAVNLYFNPASPLQPQANLTVGGDLIANYILFYQTPTSSAILEVKGNLIIENNIEATGIDDANGLNITVWGDLYAVDVNISGGNAVNTNNAGNGGILTVSGNVSVYAIYAYGGDADDSFLLTGLKFAGNGGTVDVYSDFLGRIALDGGDAIEASAGNGGDCYIDGVAKLYYFDSTGGSCNSSNENHYSGRGGYLEVDGSVTSNGSIDLSGGNRSGSLPANGLQLSPDGGDFIVNSGPCHVNFVSVTGGNIYTFGGYPSEGGNGGDVSVYGYLYTDGDIYANGGTSYSGSGGNGGYVYVASDFNCDNNIDLSGGFGGGGTGGGGGYIAVEKSIYFYSLFVAGASSGGDGVGGNGGYIDVGRITSNGGIYLSGGDCPSSDPTHTAGSGGYLNCVSIQGFPTVYASGGNRSGGTLTSNLGNYPANGGSIYVAGSAEILDMNVWGGSVSTTSPNSSGGNGGSIIIGNNLDVDSIDSHGGDCSGSSGGNGGNITIYGNLLCKYGIYAIGGNSDNGDYLAGYYIAGSGGSLQVQGNLISTFNSINLDGGDGLNSSAGNGGDISIEGDAKVRILNLTGGNCTDTGFTGNFSSGNGGNVSISGSCNAYNFGIFTDGGDGNGASGGNGGAITVRGSLVADDLSTTGGNCILSSYNTQNSGYGGAITVDGSLSGPPIINTSGGNRTGSLFSAGSATPPYAGSIFVQGSAYILSISASGGNISTTSFAPSDAGDGGVLAFRGPTRLFTTITINGGDSTTSNAGHSGTLDFSGSFSCNQLEMNGGNSLNGAGGDSGVNNWFIPGVAIFESISMNGGNGVQGPGGAGGIIYGNNTGDDNGAISCLLAVDSVINMNGGNCDSTDETHRAGRGGYIKVNSISGICDIYGNGGNRTGNTSAIWSHIGTADGGRINVFDGQANLRSIYLNGGDAAPTNPASTHYPTPGGEGGIIAVHGSFTFEQIEISGGDSYGEIGGKAGEVYVYGHCSNHADTLNPITAIGGSSYAITTPAVAAQACGEGGTFNFYGGAALSKIESKDGLAGAATTAAMEIYLYGHCSIGTLDVTDRADSKILGSDVKPSTLKVFSMPTKTTLNGPSTTSGSVSLYLSDSIFSYNSGTWYRHTGTAL